MGETSPRTAPSTVDFQTAPHAVIGTQAVVVLICGFGLPVVQLPWAAIGLVWICMIAWTFALDWAEPVFDAWLDRGVARRPSRSLRFLKRRPPASAPADAGR